MLRPRALRIPLNRTPSEESFDGVLILIQQAHAFDHAAMMRLRGHLLAVYQSQQVYDRTRRMWLIRESDALVPLVDLALHARAWLEQGRTLDEVVSSAAAEFLRRDAG